MNLDIDTLVQCKFAIVPIPGTKEFLIFHADGTADRISKKELTDVYPDVMSSHGGALDGKEKIQAFINEAIERSVNGTEPEEDDDDDEPDFFDDDSDDDDDDDPEERTRRRNFNFL